MSPKPKRIPVPGGIDMEEIAVTPLQISFATDPGASIRDALLGATAQAPATNPQIEKARLPAAGGS